MTWNTQPPTELQIEKARADLLDGKLQRARWAVKNAIHKIRMLAEYDSEVSFTWPKWREINSEGILNDLIAVDEDMPIETSWVPQKWYASAQAQINTLWKHTARASELTDTIRALKEENKKLRDEVENLTAGRQRISYSDSLRYRDLQIQNLKRKLHEKVELIKAIYKEKK